ncbi:conserved hypothetical protein [Prochlorococcus marinus str. MIT 9312]|uniref:Uncharacterized protein n=1 Tax=Prochlorococcus marinus (strain MIT 9312) TaxID=74546 RepID=Q31C47_PROM9|nr:hypothetical protein [Prochlorococcus marinus]ABB49548.1 conserved hypothetical protein [Prochlorococcus marinus str. MIT 9312]KGG01112.1 hypothetical protein EU97_0640 [Prochlorococcus marinus str. MIT 9311]
MLKNPIPQVTNQLQYRAIGIINGKFSPHDSDQLNKGFLIDKKGEKIETVVLGKALSLLKKHIDLKKSYYWVVYPKNKNAQNLHLQVAGIWDPYQLNDFPNDSSETNFSKLLKELDLEDNYFSVRGELVFVNTQKKEIVIKICSASKLKNLKNKNFKLVIKGELSLQLLNNFVSLDIIRDGNALKLIKYEVIEKDLSGND